MVAELRKQIPDPVDQVYFYGAGCSTAENKRVLDRIFHENFPYARINIAHDLMGAARSLCGFDEGIASILGTGANSCFYDGNKIVKNMPALGYVLGDEGSGSWLGKELLVLFLRDELNPAIADRMRKRFELNKDVILENVYQKEMASTYLAGFSKFIFQNLKDPQLYRLVYHGFELFFQKNIEKYENYKQLPVHFTGSVAFYYSNILRQVANDKGILVQNIVESPIAGLTLYHQKQLIS